MKYIVILYSIYNSFCTESNYSTQYVAGAIVLIQVTTTWSILFIMQKVKWRKLKNLGRMSIWYVVYDELLHKLHVIKAQIPKCVSLRETMISWRKSNFNDFNILRINNDSNWEIYV